MGGQRWEGEWKKNNVYVSENYLIIFLMSLCVMNGFENKSDFHSLVLVIIIS